MIYTVTLNPSLDYLATVEDFKMGIVNRTSKEIILPGGKGINVSLMLHNLGVKSTAFGFVAGFTGNEIMKRLVEADIVTDFTFVDKGISRINVKLRGCKETEINGMGPQIREEHLGQLFNKVSTLVDGDVLVLAGSVPSNLPDTIYQQLMKSVEDREIKVVVDTTGQQLLNVLQFHPFLIKPNNIELGELFDKKLNGKEEIVHYAKELQKKGARNVLISMAGDGAILVDERDKVYQMAAPSGKLKNSVGAGDSMVAGFVAGYQSTNDYQKAFREGVCAGSASAFSDYLGTRDEVDQLLAVIN